MKNNKSAKDIAFEKERVKFRKQIRELERELKESKKENDSLKETNEQLEAKCVEYQDWINRLLEYTDMSEEDMRALIKKEKKETEILEHLSLMDEMFSRTVGRSFFGMF